MQKRRTTFCWAVALWLLAASAGAEAPFEGFGSELTLSEPTALADVMRAPERYAERPILLRGKLADVCQKKGCWTILKDGEAHVRVRFKDYGFFLPKDSVGREAWAEGVVTVRTISEKEARHYEAESRGGDPGSIHGPQREVAFTASGVRILRPAAAGR